MRDVCVSIHDFLPSFAPTWTAPSSGGCVRHKPHLPSLVCVFGHVYRRFRISCRLGYIHNSWKSIRQPMSNATENSRLFPLLNHSMRAKALIQMEPLEYFRGDRRNGRKITHGVVWKSLLPYCSVQKGFEIKWSIRCSWDLSYVRNILQFSREVSSSRMVSSTYNFMAQAYGFI